MLRVGVTLIFVVGSISGFFGVYSMFAPSSVILSNEDLLGLTVTELHNFSPQVVDYMERYHQLYGVSLLSFAFSLLLISLIPYRRGEQWAWYALLVIGSIALIGQLLLAKKMVAITLNTVLITLWITGLTLPAKEILGKSPS